MHPTLTVWPGQGPAVACRRGPAGRAGCSGSAAQHLELPETVAAQHLGLPETVAAQHLEVPETVAVPLTVPFVYL